MKHLHFIPPMVCLLLLQFYSSTLEMQKLLHTSTTDAYQKFHEINHGINDSNRTSIEKQADFGEAPTFKKVVLPLVFSSIAQGAACTSPTIISLGKTASQSTNYDPANSYPASNAIDGNIYNFSHTNLELNPWVEINLGSIHTVTSVQVINRYPGYGRLNTFKVFVSNSPITDYNNTSQIFLNTVAIGDGATVTINASNALLPVNGQYVKVYASNPSAQYLNLAEIVVNGCTVSTSNIPPTVSISSPNSVYPISASVTLNATASDADGTISNVQFYDGANLIGSKATSPYSIAVSNLTAGSHSITAKATDNGGAITTSTAINITINPATCNDGIQNGTETGIDCGGSCTACASGGGTQWSTASITQPTYHNGVVLIGKANVNTGSETGYNLFVVGGVKAEKFKVELQASGNWADHVFHKDYKLLPIRQLGSYLKEYHHLPNFPSEKDIKLAGGYEMSDIIKRQQESIEQLHLYVIDLELQMQKMKGLEKRLADLESMLRK